MGLVVGNVVRIVAPFSLNDQISTGHLEQMTADRGGAVTGNPAWRVAMRCQRLHVQRACVQQVARMERSVIREALKCDCG